MHALKHSQLRAGAVLLLLGMLTGLLLAAAMTGGIPANGRMMLAAHLNAILGAFMLFGFALSLDYLKYTEGRLRAIGWLLIIANYGNWLITGVKALLGVHGLTYTGETANDLIFAALTVVVVLPALVGTGLWAFGFKRPGA
jgi:hydroxylaminobenzene mutase